MLKEIYNYIVTLPDRLYPFATEIEGRMVRGIRSYEHAAEHAVKMYGSNRIGYKLMLYRQAWHLIGSMIVLALATEISKEFLGSDRVLYGLLGIAGIALLFQEFYVHPKLYSQEYQKGVMDVLGWIVPIAAYFILFR